MEIHLYHESQNDVIVPDAVVMNKIYMVRDQKCSK